MKDLTRDTPPRSLLATDGDQTATQWPRDTIVVFQSAVEQGAENLWTLDVSDPTNPETKAYLDSRADLGDMVVSPDGRLAAYRSNESGRSEIYLRSFPHPGEPTIVSRSGGALPFWAPDGTTLYYGRSVGRAFFAARIREDPVPSVVSIDSLFAEPELGAIPSPGASLHPDGDRFIVALYAGADTADTREPEGGRVILVQNFFEELRAKVSH